VIINQTTGEVRELDRRERNPEQRELKPKASRMRAIPSAAVYKETGVGRERLGVHLYKRKKKRPDEALKDESVRR